MSTINFFKSFFAAPPASMPVEFESLLELYIFLQESATDQKTYSIPIHDCDDFARELQREALCWHGGRILNVQLTDDGRHMLNTAIIGNVLYKIEPQTDEVIKLCPLD